MINSNKTNMKTKQDNFKKEKQELFFIKTKQLVILVILTLLSFIVFMSILLLLIYSIKNTFN